MIDKIKMMGLRKLFQKVVKIVEKRPTLPQCM
ncbi:hypothetical protein GP2143_17386 [marine gamma proteobacterium HTCC2143]|uniref:Uncharacterized protein n=1 Tax=marine gamma proteobacterium HTCC2143 TaxID=247633 RepID=A0YA97_9GAMM|nr:hypothetical protein GP2143_17386 [marine gamma proteobacterium HTCC2143]